MRADGRLVIPGRMRGQEAPHNTAQPDDYRHSKKSPALTPIGTP